MWIDTHLLEMKVEATKDEPVPSQDQGVSGWSHGPRLPTKVSFKGGSHLGNPNPSFFLSSPISGTRFLLRVVVCNIPRFYQILEGNFCAFVLLRLIENSQGFKTFWVYLKALLKTILNSLLFLEEYLRKEPSKWYWFVFKTVIHILCYASKAFC
jgi:hypothetical protein